MQDQAQIQRYLPRLSVELSQKQMLYYQQAIFTSTRFFYKKLLFYLSLGINLIFSIVLNNRSIRSVDTGGEGAMPFERFSDQIETLNK